MSEQWIPKIGDPVKVAPDYRYGEWARVDLWVAGIRYDVRGWYDVMVSECWPPKLDSFGMANLTDGFILGHPVNSDDLIPR